jgi:hypothetical protein
MLLKRYARRNESSSFVVRVVRLCRTKGIWSGAAVPVWDGKPHGSSFATAQLGRSREWDGQVEMLREHLVPARLLRDVPRPKSEPGVE